MGGLYGHLNHPYDDLDLTFQDFREIFTLAVTGKLECQEKTDGQNAFVGWDAKSGELRFARNKGDLARGGMNAQAILDKWQHAPDVRKTYYDGYQALSNYFRWFSKTKLQRIFGRGLNVWYSAEIIHQGNVNVIPYGRNAVVFHDSGMIYPKRFNVNRGWNELVSACPTELDGWLISGPVPIQLPVRSTELVDEHMDRLMLVAEQRFAHLYYDGSPRLSHNTTLREFAQASFRRVVADDGLIWAKAAQIFASDLKPGEKKKKLTALLGEHYAPAFSADAQKVRWANIMTPIELIVHDFATAVLKDVRSQLAVDHDAVVRHLRVMTTRERNRVSAHGNASQLDGLKKPLSKLRSLDDISASLEGVTFTYKGKPYKFTGSFAPVNKILGLMRY